MSAKSSTFAAKLIEKMTLNEMTHTAYRCRNSIFIGTRGHTILHCVKTSRNCNEAICANCPKWQPSEIAEDYFANRLKGSHAQTIGSIYLERKRRGTY